MPTVKDEEGKVVAEMEYTSEGEAQAEKMVEDNLGYTITNAPDMRENYQLGGLIPGQQGFGQNPLIKPPLGNINAPLIKPPLGNEGAPLGMYEEGGTVTDEVDWAWPLPDRDKEKTITVSRKEGGKIDKYKKGGKAKK